MQPVLAQLTTRPTFSVVKTSKFSFVETYRNAIESTDEDILYRDIKLCKAASRWYVEYYYRIPAGIKHLYKNLTWKRFRIMEDMNRKKNGLEKERYAQMLLKSVAFNLSEGYNPFKSIDMLVTERVKNSETITDGINYFIEHAHEIGTAPVTIRRYICTAKRFQLYLNDKTLSDRKPREVDQSIIRAFLMHERAACEWSNTTYNNNIRYVSALFNYFIDARKDYDLAKNPCKEIKYLKATVTKHRYYDAKVFPVITEAMQKDYPYLRLASQFVYYAGVRSANEIATLKVEDILIERNLIRFNVQSKGKREDYIFLDPKLKEIILAAGIMEYPGTHYVFSRHERPDAKRLKGNYLQNMFKELRQKLGLSKDYTLYSFKHTRAIHLLTDGAQPVDIMQQFRHHGLDTTTTYIRDLGFSVATKFADKSRDI